MADLEIRIACQDDLEPMLGLNHSSTSAYAYKLEISKDNSNTTYAFQRVRLPRTTTITYPRDEVSLLNSWNEARLMYVGLVMDQVAAYIALKNNLTSKTVQVTDLVVTPELRRKGIGLRMISMGEDWAHAQGAQRVQLEIQMRNDPMIELARKAGYSMCGYLDHFFPNSDPAVFFEKSVG